MANNSTLSDLQNLKKDLDKALSFQLSKLDQVIKEAESTHVLKEKKGRVNKKDATMILMADKTVMIKFDNPSDGEAFFEGFKAK